MSLLSGFNNLLDQFLDELVLTFPELKDLRTIQTLVSLLRKMNARLVLDNFISVAGRYREKILAKDATFFENLSNWKNDPYFQTEYAQNSEEIFQRLVVFKDVWVDLTDNNKQTIWTYFRQLLIIGARANKNPDLAQMSHDILVCAQSHQP
jgi:hypothetical protein